MSSFATLWLISASAQSMASFGVWWASSGVVISSPVETSLEDCPAAMIAANFSSNNPSGRALHERSPRFTEHPMASLRAVAVARVFDAMVRPADPVLVVGLAIARQQLVALLFCEADLIDNVLVGLGGLQSIGVSEEDAEGGFYEAIIGWNRGHNSPRKARWLSDLNRRSS